MMENGLNQVVFDLEIQKTIVTDGRKINPLIEVDGWKNSRYSKMSVGVIYDYRDDRYKVYDQKNIKELGERLLSADKVIGYNHIAFDYLILREDGINIQGSELRDYDILVELWKKNGKKESGFKLDQVAKLNLACGKSENGAKAPLMFQKGEIAKLITYCIDDVRITKLLYDQIINKGFLLAKGGEKYYFNIERLSYLLQSHQKDTNKE